MVGRCVRSDFDGLEGKVLAWEPLVEAMCDALVETERGPVWFSSRVLRPIDGRGALPSRREARELGDWQALRDLAVIRAQIVKEIQHGPRWFGCEFGKALVGRGIDGAVAAIQERLVRG